jgi:hypothetical protein
MQKMASLVWSAAYTHCCARAAPGDRAFDASREYRGHKRWRTDFAASRCSRDAKYVAISNRRYQDGYDHDLDAALGRLCQGGRSLICHVDAGRSQVHANLCDQFVYQVFASAIAIVPVKVRLLSIHTDSLTSMP